MKALTALLLALCAKSKPPGPPFINKDEEHGLVITSIIKWWMKSLSIPKPEQFSCWIGKWLSTFTHYRVCSYLLMIGLKLIHVSKSGPVGLCNVSLSKEFRHCSLFTCIYLRQLGYDWFSTCSAPSHHMNQWPTAWQPHGTLLAESSGTNLTN